MKQSIVTQRIALSVVLALVSCVGCQSKSAGVDPGKMSALQQARDSGAITQQEFDSKVQTLQAAAAPSADPSGRFGGLWSSTHKEEITDPNYQMTAYTVGVPDGWKFAGTIARDPGCHSTGASLKTTMQSPDGMTGLVLMPGATWSWSSSLQMRAIMLNQHCPAIDIDSASSFLVNIAIPNLHPNAKIVAVLPLLPEGQAALAKQLAQARAQNAAMAQQYGQKPQTLSVDGARVRVQYVRNGQTVEEQISSVVDCFESETLALYKQPSSTRRSCSARNVVMFRAPQGHLDELVNSDQLKNLTKAIQPNPDWSSRLNADRQAAFQKFEADNNRQFQTFMRQNQAQFDQQMQRAREFDAQLKQSTEHAMANDRARQDAVDASAHAQVLQSLDQQEFRNPSTGQIIQASNQYNHQWMSSDGSTMIQTNDHTYDPNGQVYPVNQSWTELQPK